MLNADYCYQCSVYLLVCMCLFSVEHIDEPSENSRCCLDVDSGGPKESCVQGAPIPPRERGTFGETYFNMPADAGGQYTQHYSQAHVMLSCYQ